MARTLRDATRAGIAAALVSGIPSTLHSFLTRRPIRQPVEAAGSLLLPRETRPVPLAFAAVVAHMSLSLFWAHMLALVLPLRNTVIAGAGAGLLIAGLDLVIIGRRWARIAELPLLPQVADHIMFGAVVAAVLDAGPETRSVS